MAPDKCVRSVPGLLGVWGVSRASSSNDHSQNHHCHGVKKLSRKLKVTGSMQQINTR